MLMNYANKPDGWYHLVCLKLSLINRNQPRKTLELSKSTITPSMSSTIDNTMFFKLSFNLICVKLLPSWLQKQESQYYLNNN